MPSSSSNNSTGSSSTPATATTSSLSQSSSSSFSSLPFLFLSHAINESYHVVAKIGEGISGSVYKAIKRDTNEMVALKNFKNGADSDRTSKEECTLLMQLKHIPHITPVLDIVSSTNEYNIVFPYFEHDLSGLLSEHRFSIPQVKCYFKQLLQGIHEIHKNGVMHRDIKAANILINNKGYLFIGDLGTATSYVKRSVFSSKVVTLWYRAPELLLGSTTYGPEVDMWSIGVPQKLLNIWQKTGLIIISISEFKRRNGSNCRSSNNEQQQIEAICKLCGTPTDSNWYGVSSLPYYNMISQVPHFPSRLRSVFKNFSEDFLELLEGLLTLNPKKRLTAAQALQSSFFTNEPLPFEPEKMPGYQPIHVLEAIQKRVQQQQTKPVEQPTKQVEQQPQQEQVQKAVQQRQQVQQQPTITKPQFSQQPPTILPVKATTVVSTQPKPQQTSLQIKQQPTQQSEQPTITISQQPATTILTSPAASATNNNNNISKQVEQQIVNQPTDDIKPPQNSTIQNLKRSYDLVNDLNNYCTSESDEESDCDCEVEVVEIDTDMEVEVEVDDEYYEEDSDYYTDDEDSDYHTDDESAFSYITTRAIQTFAAQQIDGDANVNPFLQPPKKQRTTSSFSSTFNIDVPIHLV